MNPRADPSTSPVNEDQANSDHAVEPIVEHALISNPNGKDSLLGNEIVTITSSSGLNLTVELTDAVPNSTVTTI